MSAHFQEILSGLQAGDVVPYLGPYALNGATNVATGEPIPADSDSLIIAMNDGKPMAPKLMYEFPRAAMNLELKRGRSFVNRFLTRLYGEQRWTSTALHDWLAALQLPYIIDINRDTLLQEAYATQPHTLIVGISRIGGTDYRFKLHHYDGQAYREIGLDELDSSLPILFKPMGTPRPEAQFIASDADYVDYITELMGGFGIPPFLKLYRQNKRYLLLGLRLNRDTERMVLADILYGANKPDSGWALIPEPNDKERRFCKKLGLEIIEADIADLLAATQAIAA